VAPKVKRMTLMLYLYSRIYVQRQKQEFFEKFKMMFTKERMEGRVLQKMIECSRGRIKEYMKRWHNAGSKVKAKNDSLKYIYRLLYKTTIGKIYDGFSKWKSLPERVDKGKSEKAHKFSRGLKAFVDRTLGKVFGAFKN